MLNTDFNSNDVMTTSAAEEAALSKAEMMHGWYKECCQYYAENYLRAPAPVIRREIAEIIRNGMTADCLKAIMDETQNAARPSWAYCKAIVNRCVAYDIKTLNDWQRDRARREAARNPALAYQQREYSDEDFGPDFFMDMSKYKERSGAGSSSKHSKPKNPALDYDQREYREEDFGPDFYMDMSQYKEKSSESLKGGAEG